MVNYSKARHLTGQDAQPFEACLQSDEHGRQVWTTQTVTESTYQQVIELANLGMSQTEIATELGINKSNVCRHLKKAKEAGLIANKSPNPIKSRAARRADIDD
ncbi:MAG: helix-turn-helix domain-containing protein [Methylosarcina sp.]